MPKKCKCKFLCPQYANDVFGTFKSFKLDSIAGKKRIEDGDMGLQMQVRERRKLT